MNYQDQRKECNDLNLIVPHKRRNLSTINVGTKDLITTYYHSKHEYIAAVFEVKKQLKLRDSKKRIDLINYSPNLLYESFGKMQALRSVLSAIETALNIKPEKSVNDYNME